MSVCVPRVSELEVPAQRSGESIIRVIVLKLCNACLMYI